MGEKRGKREKRGRGIKRNWVIGGLTSCCRFCSRAVVTTCFKVLWLELKLSTSLEKHWQQLSTDFLSCTTTTRVHITTHARKYRVGAGIDKFRHYLSQENLPPDKTHVPLFHLSHPLSPLFLSSPLPPPPPSLSLSLTPSSLSLPLSPSLVSCLVLKSGSENGYGVHHQRKVLFRQGIAAVGCH